MEEIEKNLVTEKLMCVKLGKEVVDAILTTAKKIGRTLSGRRNNMIFFQVYVRLDLVGRLYSQSL